MYNLDSDDDELDFLHKDVNFEERSEVRKAVKAQQAVDLKQGYDKGGYYVEQYPEINKKIEEKQKVIESEADKIKIEEQLDAMDSQELKIAI